MASIVCLLIQLYMLVIFARIIMSWVPPTPGTTYARIFEAFDRATEPVLAPVRAMLPPMRMGTMGLDLSPIVVFIVGTLLLRAIC
jgi:YggT family protein